MIALRAIHSIEITSRCNLRCRYCIHPKMQRAKIDMTRATFERCMAWVRHFGQDFVDICGIGESTMHPEFVDFVALARRAVGPQGRVHFATNGVLMTDELADAILPYHPQIAVSLHRPEKAGRAIEILKKRGLLVAVSADPSVAATNWAGQVDWHVSAPPGRVCPWVVSGWAFALSDGRLTRCCFDGNATGVLGHVDDDISAYRTAPFALCAGCDQRHPEWLRQIH